MRRARVLLPLLLAGLSPLPAAAAAPDPAEILARGQSHLEDLPDGSRLRLTSPDGASSVFEVRSGTLRSKRESAQQTSGQLRTPGGYVITRTTHPSTDEMILRLEAPTGAGTIVTFSPTGSWVGEDDKGKWHVDYALFLLYLPDGTRVEVDRSKKAFFVISEGSAWTLGPEGWSAWSGPPPSAAVPVPLIVYQSGDGDDWSRIASLGLITDGWKAMPGEIPLASVVPTLRDPRRSDWLDEILSRVGAEASGAEVAAYLVAAFFFQPPGSRIEVLRKRGRDEITVILPGTLDLPRQEVMNVMSSTGLRLR